MTLISSEKARYATFQKRKKGLKKKTYELQTLCGVEVCLIIYRPKIDAHAPGIEFWPQNNEEIEALIDVYQKQPVEDRNRRTINLSHFFEDRKRKAEEAIGKLRMKNNEAKYPTWDDRYNKFSEEDLKGFYGMLENKIQEVKARIEFINGNPRLAAPLAMMDRVNMMGSNPGLEALAMVNMESNPNDSYFMQGLLRRRNMQLEVVHDQKMKSHEVDLIPMHYPYDQQNHQTVQFDGPSSNFLYNDPFDRQIYYDPLMVGMMDNMVVANSIPPPPVGYYGSNPQPFVTPYMQYPLRASGSSHQVHAPQMDDYYQVSHGLHDMKNQN
ncbi:hypothetical protein Vadar_009266 [Vaccinium darrowii]|uniref:Uncharacterized protein n=1 Tax=Vaccinium darrowii TaxID=229202 RepID=A0ACB7YD61_9ERIC|nr:hypothetical protein Vadar_009266 [Vaccinium darrowii]